MKILTLLMTLLLPLGLLADNCNMDCDPDSLICFESCEKLWTLTVRWAYYQPVSRAPTKYYSKAWLDYQVEASKRVHDYLEIWGGMCWMNKHGRIRPGCYNDGYDYSFKSSTKLSVLPFSLGIKFVYPLFSCLDFYVGLGACYSFLAINTHCKDDYSYYGYHRSPFKHSIHKCNLGGVVKAGFRYDLCCTTFLDFFVDYYGQRFRFSDDRYTRAIFRRYLDCSGYKLGVGLGVYF